MMNPPLTCSPPFAPAPFTQDDAAAVQTLAGNPAIAEMTLNIPHPYPDDAAAQWIALPTISGQRVTYAITLRDTCASAVTPAEMGISNYWNRAPRSAMMNCYHT